MASASTSATNIARNCLNLESGSLFQTGDLAGQGAPTLPVNGSFHVNELFGEIQIPIVQHNFIDELSLARGYRQSCYKTRAMASRTVQHRHLQAVGRVRADPRTFASAGPTTGPSARRTSRNCSRRSSSALDGSDRSVRGTSPIHGDRLTAVIAQGMAVGRATPPNPADAV